MEIDTLYLQKFQDEYRQRVTPRMQASKVFSLMSFLLDKQDEAPSMHSKIPISELVQDALRLLDESNSEYLKDALLLFRGRTQIDFRTAKILIKHGFKMDVKRVATQTKQ